MFSTLDALKSRLFKTRPDLSGREFFVCLMILLLAAYMLAPRFWEPGGESMKNWVSARIFRQTGGFPVLHHGPLYNLYLQIFLCFDYPLSLNIERVASQIFAYVSIFLLLCRFLPIIPALALTIAWIPSLWVLEGGARPLGIGLVSLYFRADNRSLLNKGCLPVFLGAAALCDSAYMAFLLGHVIGILFMRRINKEPFFTFLSLSKREEVYAAVIKVALVLLVILTILFQSPRLDNNVHAFEYPWVPIPQIEILTESNLQIGNMKYIMRNFSESEWIYKDWYFTHEKAFGGAQSMLEAALKRPDVFFKNILENVPGIMNIPLNWAGIVFSSNIYLIVIAWILFFISLREVFKYYRDKNLASRLFSIACGTAVTVVALLLVHPAQRYVMVLLPVGILTLGNAGKGIQFFISFMCNASKNEVAKESGLYVSDKMRKALFASGLFFILLAFLVNEWSLGYLHPAGHIRRLGTIILIWCFDLTSIIFGLLLIMRPCFFLKISGRIKALNCSNKETWISSAFILPIAGFILATTYNHYGNDVKIVDLLGYQYLLAGAKPVSIADTYHQLFASVNKQTKVLSMEEPWIRAFADVDLDRIFHPLYLPPFMDNSGKIEEFMNSLDVIWVSHHFSNRIHSTPTQIYLRYELHVAPFLKKAIKIGWTVQDVEGFGKIYRRPQ